MDADDSMILDAPATFGGGHSANVTDCAACEADGQVAPVIPVGAVPIATLTVGSEETSLTINRETGETTVEASEDDDLEGAPISLTIKPGSKVKVQTELAMADLPRLKMFLVPKGAHGDDARFAPLEVLQGRCFSAAAEKGWHPPENDGRTIGDYIALMHSELSEMLEEHRKGLQPITTYSLDAHGARILWPDEEVEVSDLMDRPMKPEGLGIELADLVIRALDFAETYAIKLPLQVERKLRYNATRPYRHGGKTL